MCLTEQGEEDVERFADPGPVRCLHAVRVLCCPHHTNVSLDVFKPATSLSVHYAVIVDVNCVTEVYAFLYLVCHYIWSVVRESSQRYSAVSVWNPLSL